MIHVDQNDRRAAVQREICRSLNSSEAIVSQQIVAADRREWSRSSRCDRLERNLAAGLFANSGRGSLFLSGLDEDRGAAITDAVFPGFTLGHCFPINNWA